MADAIALEVSSGGAVVSPNNLPVQPTSPDVKSIQQKEGGMFGWLKKLGNRSDQVNSTIAPTLESLAQNGGVESKIGITREQASPAERKQLLEKFGNSKAGKFAKDLIIPMIAGGFVKQGVNAALIASGFGWGGGAVAGGVWGAFHSGVRELNVQEQKAGIETKGWERAKLVKRVRALSEDQRHSVYWATGRGAAKGAIGAVIGAYASDMLVDKAPQVLEWVLNVQTADAKELALPDSFPKDFGDQEVASPPVSSPIVRPNPLLYDSESPLKLNQPPAIEQTPLENPLLGSDKEKAEMATKAIEGAKAGGFEVKPSKEFLNTPLPTPINNLETMNPEAPQSTPTPMPEKPAVAPTLSSELNSVRSSLPGSEATGQLVAQGNNFSTLPTGVAGQEGSIVTLPTPTEPALAEPLTLGHETAEASGQATDKTPLTGNEKDKADMAEEVLKQARDNKVEIKPSKEFLDSGFPGQSLNTMNPDAVMPPVDQGAVNTGGGNFDQPTSDSLPPADTAREEMERQALEKARKNNVDIKPTKEIIDRTLGDPTYSNIGPTDAADQAGAVTGSTTDGMKPLSPNTEDFAKDVAEKIGVPEKLQPLFDTIKETGGVVASSDGPSGNARDLLIAAVGPENANTISQEEIDKVAKLIMQQNNIGGAYGLEGATPATAIESGRVLVLNDEILDILKKKAA